MIDMNKEEQAIIAFIKKYVSRSGFKRVVIGISGGIDSAVVAALAVKALGKGNVSGLLLPYKTSSKENVEDALQLIDSLQIEHKIIDISPMVDSYFVANCPDADVLRKGNFMARIRMCVLYDHSAAIPALVIGTGNKSELLTGYTTQYGDNACAFEPIGHLYKTEVKILAKQLGIPQAIIDKKPSADLWEGQSDEEEIGLSYELLDDILARLIDDEIEPDDLIASSYNAKAVNKVWSLYQKSAFKREMPPDIKSYGS